MTTISQSISYVRSDVCSKRHAVRFDAARERQPPLTSHASASALVGALDGRHSRDYERSEPIVRALIAEYGFDRHTLCTSLLLLLCRPMLVGLRDEITGDVLPSDELDQLVMASFLEAVGAISATETRIGQTFAQLNTLTRRAVMRAIKAAQREREVTDVIDPAVVREMVDGELPVDRIGIEPAAVSGAGDHERDAQRRFLRERAEGLMSAELIDMIAHTLIDGGRLVDWVARAHPGVRPEELERIYARDKRRHARALVLLKKATAPLRAALIGKAVADPADGTGEHRAPEQSGEFVIYADDTDAEDDSEAN